MAKGWIFTKFNPGMNKSYHSLNLTTVDNECFSKPLALKFKRRYDIVRYRKLMYRVDAQFNVGLHEFRMQPIHGYQ